MESLFFTFNAQDEKTIQVYKWKPETTPKALLLIVHGLADHARRYNEFAKYATKAGYVVYAPDLRGHGKTANGASGLGIIDNNGWNFIVNDLKILSEKMKTEYPNLPMFLFGHSLGSEFSLDYMIRWGTELKGVVLSAPQSQQPFYILLFGEMLGKNEIKKLGPVASSNTFKKLAWDKFNRVFKDSGTNFDWISTDSKAVKDYIDDPLCGWIPSTIFSTEITRGFKRTHKKSHREMIPNNLPIFVITGSQDSTNRFGKNVKILVSKLKRLGKTIQLKIYSEKRHDLLHEQNRTEIIQDILKWFDSKM